MHNRPLLAVSLPRAAGVAKLKLLRVLVQMLCRVTRLTQALRPRSVASCTRRRLRAAVEAQHTPLALHLLASCRVSGRRRAGHKLCASRDGDDRGVASTPAPLVDDAEAGTGRLLLVLVAAMFASMTVAIRFVYVQPSPPSASVLSAIRGLMAAACFAPLLVSRAGQLKSAPPGFWRAVLELASLNVGFQSLLNAAVLYSDATRAGFLFQGCVVFTPLLCVLSGRPVTLTTWLAAAAAALGVALLALDGGAAAAAAGGLSVGDALALGAALGYSLFILRLSEYGARGLSTDMTQACKCVVMAAMYALWVLVDCSRAGLPTVDALRALWPGAALPFGASATATACWAALLYSAVVPGALADVLQARGQRTVPAAEAQVLLAAEPLWTALLGVLLLGETCSPAGWAGGAVIVAAVATASGGLDAFKSK